MSFKNEDTWCKILCESAHEYDTAVRVLKPQWYGKYFARNLGGQRELEQRRLERERQLGSQPEHVECR